MLDLIKILFLASNPTHPDQRHLDLEIKAIRQRIRPTPRAAQIQIEQEWALSPEEIPAALMRHEPHIVHFSGHGDSDGSLVLMHAATQAMQKVTPAVLARVFGALPGRLVCVVLNACFTQVQAAGIAQVIPTVVGMAREVSDEAATAFAAGFYEALAFGKSIKKAFELGCVQLELKGRAAEAATPQLTQKAGVDAARLHLIGTSPSPPGPDPRQVAVWNALTRLDRDSQWHNLKDSVDKGAPNTLVLLHGDSSQGLPVFIERIDRYFATEHRTHCRCVFVPMHKAGSQVVQSSDYSWHLRQALADTLKRHEGSLPELLAEATEEAPLLLILVDSPVGIFRSSDLVPEQVDILRQYLCQDLAADLYETSGICVLLPVETDAEGDPLLGQLRTWLATAAASGAVLRRELKRLCLPTWDEVELYIRNYQPPIANGEEILIALKPVYDRLTAQQTSFTRLAEEIDRLLHRLWKKRP